MKRPKRENYAIGIYGEISYQSRIEKYCTYLENKIRRLNKAICKCGSNDFYAEVYKDVTKYYCGQCGEKV
jgi:ribosomal protein S27AE